jgi:uncharacterized protein YcfL
MKKGVVPVIIVVICSSVLLSGCQDTSSVKTQQRPQNVYLDSSIVEFANVSFEKNVNKSGGVESVTVGWLFHNIAGKMISAKIDVKFYDKNNQFLYNASKYINNLPAGYTEQSLSLANKVTYDGVSVPFVDHVIISVTER